MYFRYLYIYLPLEKGGAYDLKYSNSLHSKMLCVKFGLNLPSCSGEDDFSNLLMYFSQIRNYLPLEKGGALQLNKLGFPSSKDDLCQNWPTGSGEDFENWSMYFPYFILSPLEKSGALHLYKLESPSSKNALCHVWLKLTQMFWRRS